MQSTPSFESFRDDLIEYFGEPARAAVQAVEESVPEYGSDQFRPLSAYRFMSMVYVDELLISAVNAGDHQRILGCLEFAELILGSEDYPLIECFKIRVGRAIARYSWEELFVAVGGPKVVQFVESGPPIQ